MSRFWNTASAVPRYHDEWMRCWAGSSSTNSPMRPSMLAQPRCTWRIRLCALYCVAMPMRRLRAPVGERPQPLAAPAREHDRQGLARELGDVARGALLARGQLRERRVGGRMLVRHLVAVFHVRMDRRV